ncbi:trichohyalin-like isoform X2 [Acanthochromis polyacanthus]|uniref:trichohyalin-like isoform X2 n=1 Tax=Acanthochromis polyacanthus TaxID=80966 RepID=UPI002234D87D|nr:trichohyalin-like isoform X2 [Acanthochromis polyacanthus]
MELLKSVLEMKRQESEGMFRKNMRKMEDNKILWNEVQEEKKSLRRETKRSRRELDQRLENNARQRDELELLRIKIRKQKEELAEERMRIQDLTVLIYGYGEHEKHNLEKKDMKSFSKIIRMVHETSKITDSISNLQNIRQKFHVHLQIIMRETGILENVSVDLRKQRDGLKALKNKNMNVRDNMGRVKSQIKHFEKITTRAKAEMDKMVHIRNDIQKQKQELDITQEKAKRERREMEVLTSELEMKKRENQQIIRKCIQTEQEGKIVWAAVKEEKDLLKRETQKRKKELNQQLERIIRERDELEIMNLRLKTKKDENRSKMVKSRTSAITEFQNQIQKHWELTEICIEKYKHMKTHCSLMIAAIKDEKQHIKVQEKMTTLTREEVANTRIEMKKRMEVMIHELKNVQQKREYLGQVETNIQKEENSIKTKKKRTAEKTEVILLRKEERENETEILKGEMMTLKDKKQNLKILRTPIRRKRISTTQDEIFLLRSKTKLNQDTEETKHEYLKEKEELTAVKQLENEEKGKSGKVKDYTEKDHNELEGDEEKEEEKKHSTPQGKNAEENEEIQSENKSDKRKLQGMCRKKIKNQWKSELGKRKDAERRKSQLEERKGKLKKPRHKIKEKFKTERDMKKKAAKVKEQGEGQKKVSTMMNKEKVDLVFIRSQILKQTEKLEEENKIIKDERHKLEMTMAELQEKKENTDNLFDEIKREKTKMSDLKLQLQTNQKRLEEMMNTIALKQKQHEVKNDEFNKQTQEVKSMKKKVLVEREELEVQKKSFKKKEEEFEAFMKTMREEKEQVSQTKAEMEREREAMLNESIRMEGERSELKMRDDQVKKRMESIESVREKLEWLNGRMREDIKHKMDNLQQNSDAALQLHTVLEQKLATLNDQKNTVACYTEMVEKQQDSMKSLLSELTSQREEMENEWEQQLEDEKQHLMKLKAELKEEREDLKKVSEVLNKDKVDLELMRSEILKQSQILEQEKQDVKDEKDMLEMTMAELQEKTENADNLFDEIKREKTKMSDLKLQLQTNQKRLEEMMNMIALKQKQHEVKNDEFNKQTQEVKSMKKKVLAEREELEVQKKSFTLDTWEITMTELPAPIESNYLADITPTNKKSCRITKCIESETNFSLNEPEEIKEKVSEIIITQDQFGIVLNAIVRFRRILELFNQKTYQVSCLNINRFEHKNRTILKLLTTLGHTCAEIDQLINLISFCYCQIQCKKAHLLKGKLHKSVQTEAAVQEFLHEHDVERKDFTEFQESQYMKDVQQSSCMNQTDKWEHQQKCDRGQGNLQGTAVSMKPEREGLLIRAEGKEVINVEMKKLAKVSELSAAIDDFTEQQMSNRECLRKIWKGTRVEQKEISQMKCGAHDMRNNLEKRLKVISHLVKKTLSQKGKTTKKTKLENDQSKDTFSQNDWNGDHKSLNEKYLELQQFKMSMFSQFEKLHNREKVTLTTSNKTNQKNQIDIFTGHPPDQVLQQASTKINQEQINAGEPEEAPETSNGFLCQLRHYCYRCCCCAHCKQVFPKVK